MNKIAIVEDNPDNRLLLRVLLQDDYEIIEYETGTEALQGMQKDPPDLVLMDISLPGMDGVEILEKLRAESTLETIPVIAVTAHAMAGDREKYLNLGFNDYLTKPILDEKLLMEIVERWMA